MVKCTWDIFTLFSKADFNSYLKKIQGYNTLLPFGFHSTGTTMNQKLNDEQKGLPVDVSISNILKSVGFANPRPFIDPLH